MESTLTTIVATSRLQLRRRGVRTKALTIRIGDLTAFNAKDKLLEGLPFDDPKASWRITVEVTDGWNSPLTRGCIGGDSIEAIGYAYIALGQLLTMCFGNSEQYRDMLPNYGFPSFVQNLSLAVHNSPEDNKPL